MKLATSVLIATCIFLNSCYPVSSQTSASQRFEEWAFNLYTTYRFGLYDRVVGQAIDYLGSGQGSDKRIVYLRGMASAQLGDFTTALADFTALGDYVPYPKWQNAQEWVQKVRTTQAVLPPNLITPDKGVPGFRVYFDRETPFARAVMKLLPTLFVAARDGLRIDPPITTVFITDNPSHATAIQNDLFKTTLFTPSPLTSAGAYLFFNEPSDQLQKTVHGNPDTDYFRLLAVDFYATTLLSRGLGRGQLALWLRKGITAVIASALAPAYRDENDRRARDLFTKGFLLPLEELNVAESLKIKGLAIDAKGNYVKTEVLGAEPQTQGFHFIRYMVAKSPRGAAYRFLNLLAEKAAFESAFSQAFGQSPETAYAAWKASF